MQKLLVGLGFSILAFCSNVSRANDDTSAMLQRTLHMMKYGSSMKFGLNLEKTRAGKTSAFVEAVIAASDDEVEAVCARVLSKYITLEDVVSILGFYTGPTGRLLIENQSANPSNPNPTLSLSPAQIKEAQVFSATTPAMKFIQVSRNGNVRTEVMRALEAEFLKSRDSSGNIIKVSYADKIKKAIMENIHYSRKNNNENSLSATFLVNLFPNGEVLSIEKKKESGDPEYDKAIEDGILKSSPLPKKYDGTVERTIILDFRDK